MVVVHIEVSLISPPLRLCIDIHTDTGLQPFGLDGRSCIFKEFLGEVGLSIEGKEISKGVGFEASSCVGNSFALFLLSSFFFCPFFLS